MDRYDPYTDKFLRDTQYNILSTNLAEVGTDCISRQQAIDALVAETIYTEEELKEYYEANSHRNEWVNGIYEAVEVIKQLPPAQPERIIHCKDCEWWTKQECSPQGRCALSGMYPTGGWFCGNARRREVTT